MPTVILRAPLSELCGQRSLAVEGGTVGEALRMLESDTRPLRGWILDERGRIREHVNVYVNGDLASEDTAVPSGARIHVLPAITGG